MSDAKIDLSEARLNEIHERVRRTIQARDQSADLGLDLDCLSRIALDAYLTASCRDESLEKAESRALEALRGAGPETRRMQRAALRELTESGGSARASRGGFWIHLAFGVLVPTIATMAAWITSGYSNEAAQALWFVALGGFFVTTLIGVSYLFFGADGSFAFFYHALNSLQQCGAAITTGFVVLAISGWVGHKEIERRQQASFEKWNQALAVALAGAQAGASLSDTQEALRKVTHANWIRLDDSPNQPGAWLASADDSQYRLTARAQVNPPGQDFTDLPRVQMLKPSDGANLGSVQYVYGRVVKTDLDKITLQLPNNQQRTVTLPEDAVRPVADSEVMAVLSGNGEKAVFLQVLDGLVASFNR